MYIPHIMLSLFRCIPVALLCVFVVPHVAEAHQPKVIGTPDQHDVYSIDTPEISRAFYGELVNHPHMYEIVSTEPFRLYTQILVPDIEGAQNNISGIVLRVLANGSVEEVTRLHAEDAGWESFYEPFGGDTYREGPEFEADVAPGTYRIEMSTPDNIGKYVLAVGKEENFEGVGYFETVREIARVKVFFGKSQFAIIQSPFVYVPLIILIVLIFVVRFVWRKIQST